MSTSFLLNDATDATAKRPQRTHRKSIGRFFLLRTDSRNQSDRHTECAYDFQTRAWRAEVTKKDSTRQLHNNGD
jgi:hypothetical protein